MGFTGICIIFLIFALKHEFVGLNEAVLICTHNLWNEKKHTQF